MRYVTPETLYELLPAVHRIRDAERGGPLRALIEVLGQQGRLLEEDIARLYDNAFIETCEEWVVPYIGDLLGVRNLHALGEVAGFSQRSRVANTLAYRRRKGTATMLEQLARDTTGWPARAVEFFDLIATTQHTNHPRLHNHRAPDVRDANRLELIDGPFDPYAHTADVRRISQGRGRYNIPNVGLFLWRLEAYVVERTEARAVTDPSDGRYWLHPYGIDIPLVNRPQTETEITHLAEEVNVPAPLRRRPLFDELEARREAFEAGEAPAPVYFGGQPPVEIFLDGAAEALEPEQILVCDLSTWDDAGWAPSASVLLSAPGGDTLRTRVAVDPVLGRLAVLTGVPIPVRVEARYAYGFPGDVGGGPYDRQASLGTALGRAPGWSVTVGASGDLSTVEEAVADWNTQPPGTLGLLTLLDNATYTGDLTGPNRIRIPEGSRLVVVSASESSEGEPELVDRFAHLLSSVEVEGTAPADSPTPGSLVLNGLMIEGGVRVRGASSGDSLGSLHIAHCTIGFQDPTAPQGLRVGNDSDANRELVVELDRTLCGPIVAPATIQAVAIRDSVVQGEPHAVAGPGGGAGPVATIERSTLFGRVHVQEMALGSESLFTESVVADRLQTGCVRFSYVPTGSRTPRRFRCQPDLAIRRRAEALGLGSAADLPAVERNRILRRIRPSFTAVRYGDPAFAQLSLACAVELRTGAEDGSEIGVWSLLKQPQRIANLTASLEDYLRFGLEAGLLFAT